MNRSIRLASTLALLGALAGCGTGAPGASTMALTAVGGSKKAAGKAATAKAPTAKAAAGKATVIDAPAIQVPVGAPVAAAGAGTLRVAFASLAPATRSLMALDDVAGVRVTLTAANGATQVQVLDREDLAGANPGVSFAGVAVGHATLAVEVLDAAGAVIGQASAGADVVAKKTVEVGLTVHLAAATGNVAANVSIVEDAAPTPTPAPSATPTPTASIPSFLASATPTATPTPAPSASWPSFLSSTAPTTHATREVWGRLYDYAGNQVTNGRVRFASTDAAVPFDVSADLRADGYYYVPGVPCDVTVQVEATAGARGVTAWYLFSESAATTYDWLDLFVQ